MQAPPSRTIERHERRSAGRVWFEPRALPAGILCGPWRPKQPSSQIPMLFFGLIVSVTDREWVLREGLERACIECVCARPHRLVEVYRQLALFFVPAWRWNRRYFLVCGICGHAESISPEEADALCGGA